MKQPDLLITIKDFDLTRRAIINQAVHSAGWDTADDILGCEALDVVSHICRGPVSAEGDEVGYKPSDVGRSHRSSRKYGCLAVGPGRNNVGARCEDVWVANGNYLSEWLIRAKEWRLTDYRTVVRVAGASVVDICGTNGDSRRRTSRRCVGCVDVAVASRNSNVDARAGE
jgi:hypothetical protein